MRQLNWKAACLFVVDDPQWRAKLKTGGLWLLLCPPLGWLIALGFRKEVALNLVAGKAPVLPQWQRQHRLFLVEGMKALGVIITYYVPFFLWFFSSGLNSWANLQQHYAEVALFGLGVVGLTPVGLPGACLWMATSVDWFQLSHAEAAVAALLFVTTTLIIPAGFVQVARTQRFRDAFDVRAMARLLVRCPRAYAEAWLFSLIVTVLALCSGPLVPFAIIWSYQAIIYAFNEVAYLESKQRSVTTTSPFGAYRLRGAAPCPRDDAEFFDAEFFDAVGLVDASDLAGATITWRPYLAIRRGVIEYQFATMKDDGTPSLKQVLASVCVGEVRVPLPMFLQPTCRIGVKA